MSDLVPLLGFVALVVVAAVAGVRLGMLLAPRIDRMTERNDDDEPGDDD